MLFIKHRVNKRSDLVTVKQEWGVEIDLRSHVDAPGKIFLSHDPWVEGDDLETWVEGFNELQIKGPIILNTKEDGLENRALEIMKRAKISNFFFLDTALPTLVKWAEGGRGKHLAVRLSLYEPLKSVELFLGKVDWVWVDCFGGKPLPVEMLRQLHGKIKICVVSPELHGQSIDLLSEFYDLYALADAVCTKQPEKWKQIQLMH